MTALDLVIKNVRLVRHDGSRRDLEYAAVAHVLPGLRLSVLRDVTYR